MDRNGAIVPEYMVMENEVLDKLRDGAELYIVYLDGKETLIAKYKKEGWEKI